MLTPEQAQLRLKAVQIPEIEQWCLKAVATLPDEPLAENIRQAFVKRLTQNQPVPATLSLRGMGYGLISHNIDGTAIDYNLLNSYELRRPRKGNASVWSDQAAGCEERLCPADPPPGSGAQFWLGSAFSPAGAGLRTPAGNPDWPAVIIT